MVSAEPAPERESIEFRDYLRDHEVMSLEIETLLAATRRGGNRMGFIRSMRESSLEVKIEHVIT